MHWHNTHPTNQPHTITTFYTKLTYFLRKAPVLRAYFYHYNKRNDE